MRIRAAVIAGMVGLAVSAYGQTNELGGMTFPDAAARARMEEARRQFRQSDQCKELRAAVEAADRAFFAAAAEIPELKQLDDQIAGLTQQVRALRMRRMEIEKTSAALAEKRAAADKAHDDFHTAMKKALAPVEAQQ